MTQPTLGLDSNLFRKNLLQWYYSQARKLPWRSLPTDIKTVTPYATAVSEFMLQQTQVKTVLPYFDRWLQQFPDFAALATASQESVLKHWEGLGYYSRAKNLQRLAQEVIQCETLPKTAEEWIQFPGVGDYTAAAIASIAFNQPAAVVDGNVIRILIRLTAHEAPFEKQPKAYAFARPIARELLNHDFPGDHNQAMMELGATICTPKNPLCEKCPVQNHCQAYRKSLQYELPKLPKRTILEKSVNRAWVEDKNQLLLKRIDADAKRLANVYELPHLEDVTDRPSDPLHLRWQKKRSIALERITESIYYLTKEKVTHDTSAAKGFQWVPFTDLNAYTLSGPHRRWIESFIKEDSRIPLFK